MVPRRWSKSLKEQQASTFNARAETVETKPFFRDACRRNGLPRAARAEDAGQTRRIGALIRGVATIRLWPSSFRSSLLNCASSGLEHCAARTRPVELGQRWHCLSHTPCKLAVLDRPFSAFEIRPRLKSDICHFRIVFVDLLYVPILVINVSGAAPPAYQCAHRSSFSFALQETA